jgi:hypothetical protein
MQALVGQELECHLRLSRRFNRESAPQSQALLYSVHLGRDQRSVLAYLPADAFWALQDNLIAGRLTNLELTYEKPSRGYRELISVYLS